MHWTTMLLALAAVPGVALAGPTVLTLSGRVLTSSGEPLAGLVDVEYRLVDDAGQVQWNESIDTVFVDGHFATPLGATTTLDPERLEDAVAVVLMDGTTELHRAPLRSAPYSLAVDGAVRLVDAQTVCDAARAGSLRYIDGEVQSCDGSAWSALASAASVTSKVVGFAHARDAVPRSMSGTIPWDDSTPQSNEGSELLSVTITPKEVGNLLVFKGMVHWVEPSNTADYFTVALFRQGASSAVATASDGASNGNGRCTANGYSQICTVPFLFTMPAPSTNAETFVVRVGINSGPVYINRSIAGRRLGGSLASTLSVTEISQ